MLEPTVTVFGHAEAARCQARSKRSGRQCRKPALKGQAVCRIHGGRSTGPTTPEGRQRCAEARVIHRRERRQTRRVRAEKLRELRQLQGLMAELEMLD